MKFDLKRTEKKGFGVFATEGISAYTVISKIKYIRELTEDKPLDEDEKHLQDHIHYWPDGRMFIVDEPDTYFNHSCAPNAYIYSADRNYYIVSREEIKAGEEITIDYELHTTGQDSSWECKCGAPNCRGMHKWDFFLLPPKVICESLPFLDPWFAQLHGDKIREILDQEMNG